MMWNALVGFCIAGWALVGVFSIVFHEDLDFDTDEAKWAATFVLVVLGPLMFAAAIGYALFKSGATLVVGFIDLWEQLGPVKKAKLPRAKVE
jgi:hypothetical protein